MSDKKRLSRREAILAGGASLGALSLGQMVLGACARPTEPSGSSDAYGQYLSAAQSTTKDRSSASSDDSPPAMPVRPTEDNILGPFHRSGAPFRAKVTPPLEPGTPVVVKGTVWSFKTKRPLAGVTLDIWQANAKGRYDNDDPRNPPATGIFVNRARVVTDQSGYYEFETIHPGRYKIGPDLWRPSHIHYWVRHPDHKELITQLYFRGDPYNKVDQFIKKSLIVDFKEEAVGEGRIELGRFDIVLEAA